MRFRFLLTDAYLQPAIKAYNSGLAQHLTSLETTRPKLERRLKKIQETRRKLLQILERGVEANVVADRFLELDQDERTTKEKLHDVPRPVSP